MTTTASFERLESNVRMYCRDIPPVFISASGSVVHDEDGKSYLDFFAGAGALNYGHNNPVMREAIINHLTSDGVVHGLDLHTDVKRDFLEALERDLLQPRGLAYKAQFTGPTGADANEAALKLARKVTGRTGVVAFHGGFHGMTAGAMAVSASRKNNGSGVDLSHNVTFVPFEDGPLGPFDALATLERLAADPRSGTDLPAAVIVESVQIQAGVYAASDEWLVKLRDWTRENGVVLICDEVQAGCGRAGDFFGFERSGIHPDIVTCAKSIGGFGLPMALVLIAPELDVWNPGEHTGTFRGNQLAFVAAKIALGYWQDPEFLELVRKNSEVMAEAMEALAAVPGVSATRTRGMIAAIDFGLGNTEAARQAQVQALELGVLVERCGPADEVIKLMPPINIPTDQLREGLATLATAVAASDAAVTQSDAR